MSEQVLNADHCVFCGNPEATFQYSVHDIFDDTYSLMQCASCNCFYLSPHPSDAQLARAYDDSYYGAGDKKFNPIIEQVLDYFRNQRSAFLRKKVPDNARVLDIGCGNGRFLQYLGRKGNYQLYGIEPPGNSAKRAALIKEINLLVGTLKSDLFKESFFDAVTLFHVFEHLRNPNEILDIIKTIVKPGGVLILSFPNINSWQARYFKGNWLHLDPPRHLFYFNPNDLISILNKKGFDCVQQHYLSTEQNPFGFVQSALNTISRKREILFESFKGNKDYLKDYSRFKYYLHVAYFIIAMPYAVVADIFVSWLKKGATIQMTFIKRATQ